MPTRTGVYNTSTDVKWDDPRAQEQAQAIGAILKADGKLYDAQTGKNIKQAEADQRAIRAGVAIDSNRPRAGYLNQVYDRNQGWIDPALQIGASMVPGIGPALSAAVGAGLSYGKDHNLGKAAIAGAKNYGLSKIAGKVGDKVGKLPGAQAVQSGLSKIPGAGTVVSAADKISQFGNAVNQRLPGGLPGPQPVGGIPGGMSGGQAPGGGGVFDKIGGFLTGNSGLNALATAQGVNAAMLQKQSMDYAKKAMQNTEQNWKDNEGLRTAGRAGMLNPATPDFSEITNIRRAGNPFARPMPVGV
jgi:hypothetical protein